MYFLAVTRQADVDDRLTTLTRTTAARTGLDNGTARTLKRVLDGRLANGGRSVNTRTTLGLLARLGMISSTERGPMPSPAVKSALDVP
jgi:hypothetical protein